MLTAALANTGEENCTEEKITFYISPTEAPKGGAGKSEGQMMNGEKIGGDQPSGAAFGWSCENF